MVNRHRAEHDIGGGNTNTALAQRALPGRGPGGVWWVTWRQHRMTVLVALMVLHGFRGLRRA